MCSPVFLFPLMTLTVIGDGSYSKGTPIKVFLRPEDLSTPHRDQEKGTMKMET